MWLSKSRKLNILCNKLHKVKVKAMKTTKISTSLILIMWHIASFLSTVGSSFHEQTEKPGGLSAEGAYQSDNKWGLIFRRTAMLPSIKIKKNSILFHIVRIGHNSLNPALSNLSSQLLFSSEYKYTVISQYIFSCSKFPHQLSPHCSVFLYKKVLSKRCLYSPSLIPHLLFSFKLTLIRLLCPPLH